MLLPAKAENVAVVRHALAGLAEEIGMDEPGIADLKTVVTEACMNVVVHAYAGEAGPLTVEANPDADGLTVVVRDRGPGHQAAGRRRCADSLRLGLSLIAALSSSFAISGGLDRGTEVTMRVPLRGGGADGGGTDGGDEAVEMRPTATEVDGGLRRSPGAACPGARPHRRRPRRTPRPLRRPDVRRGPRHRRDRRRGTRRVHRRPRPPRPRGRRGRDPAPPRPDGGRRRGADPRGPARCPDVGGSLEALVDDLSVEESEDGEYLLIRFAAAAPAA